VAGVVASVAVDLPMVLRAAAVAGLVLAAPGLAVMSWVPHGSLLARSVLVVALSLAITTVTSGALAIASVWSPGLVAVLLGGGSAIAVLWPRRDQEVMS
jgi:hypothetical protein